MKVGLVTSSTSGLVDTARAAEDAGFHYLCCSEHLFFHGPASSPFVELAAAAGATSRIRLLSTVSLLPLYPAAIAAKLAATLDRVSGGRFEFGVGSGGENPAEFEAAGVDPRTRFRRTEESLEVCRRLFTGERVTFEGEFTTLRDLALDPPPVQPGGPPIWLGGRKPGALVRAGRFADVWLPYMVTPAQLERGLSQVRETAVGEGRGADAVAGAVFLWCCVDDDPVWARAAGVGKVSRTYDQDFGPLADKYLVLGDPDRVVERIEGYRLAGADTVVLQIAADGLGRDRVIDTLVRRVLPAL